jgi:hypothetical protein
MSCWKVDAGAASQPAIEAPDRTDFILKAVRQDLEEFRSISTPFGMIQ